MNHPKRSIVHLARLAGLGSILIAGCATNSPSWLAVAHNGMVATDSRFASNVGRNVLRAGGNAIDAATAVSFALAVTRPYSTGLGGGGFMMVRLGNTGDVFVFDFRESAPVAATQDMFTRSDHSTGPDRARVGALAVAVPGLVAGRLHAQQRFGTRPLAELLRPAIQLARGGFPVDEHYVETSQDVLKIYTRHPQLVQSCNYVYRIHLHDGQLPHVGDRLVQPRLADLLDEIAQHGSTAFYRGHIADAIIDTIQKNGGIMTLDDLANYRVIEREPLITTYRDHTLILMPPPSSGGVCIAETLNILENFDLRNIWRHDSTLACHYVIEAMKHAFADRARWLGDPDESPLPIHRLTGKRYGRQLARTIDPSESRRPADDYGAINIPDDAGTSHFCIVDQWNNAVVSTETINTGFGSLLAVDEWGLILNNEMDDFSARPGQPNAFGLTQSDRNAIRAGSRPLSSMSPTIVLQDDKLELLLGASGGPRIISSVLNVILNSVEYNLPLMESIKEIRVHHQWKPDEVVFDRKPPRTLQDALESRGHNVANQLKTGIVQAIQIKDSQLIGASDPRKGGLPAGH